MKNFIVFAGFCLFLLTACGDDNAQKNDGQAQQQSGQNGGEQPPKPVSIITVQPQKIAISNQLPGRVRASMTAEIRPQVSGIIQERLFDEGSFVEEGQQLYQIDPARYEADYQRAKANLENAQAEQENAQALQGRYQRLIDANAVSQQEFDNASASVKQARAAISLAQAEVKTAKINLDYTKVYSPITGYIGPSAVTEGALVTAQQEMALATVRQLDPVYVDLSQSAAEAQQLQERLMKSRMDLDSSEVFEVTILLGNAGDTYPRKGTLDATDLAVDENTGTIQLRSVFPNPNGFLLPGMFVRATIEEIGEQKSIIVPQKAVSINQDGSKSIWVVGQDNTAVKRDVRTGSSYQNNWVIMNGLNPGDKVITKGTMMLREGAKVAPTEQGEDMGQADKQAMSNSMGERALATDTTLGDTPASNEGEGE